MRCWDGGDVMIAEGPFAQTREQVTGLFIVECQDLTEAIQVATTIPAAWYGTVEVRPVRPGLARADGGRFRGWSASASDSVPTLGGEQRDSGDLLLGQVLPADAG